MSGTSVANIGLGFGADTAASAPAVPSIVAAAGTLAVTITIDGEPGITNHLLYKPESGNAWSDGGSRVGDGDITVSGLYNGVAYTFIAYSQSGAGPISQPSPSATVTLQADDDDQGEDLNDELAEGIDEALEVSGETITYKPGGIGSRSIVGIVDRFPPAAATPAPQGRTPKAIVVVKNSNTEGISSAEIDTGLDKISYPVRIGQTPKDCNIAVRNDEDPASLSLEVF